MVWRNLRTELERTVSPRFAPKAYIAGPLFNVHERWYLEGIASVVERAGFDTFLPHRDAKFPDESDVLGIFGADVEGLTGCQLVIALLDGQDIDSGTCVELGIAYTRGIPVLGVTTDEIRRVYANAMPMGVCLSSFGVVHGLDELAADLPAILIELAKEEKHDNA